VLVDPARKIRIGNKLFFGDNELTAEVIDNTTSRGRTLRFLYDGPHDEFKKRLLGMGDTPIPDCILQKRDVVPEDKTYYQTIYAKHEGAVVAPTAGLHFSKNLLKRLELKGINFADITLHAGVGNFRLIDVEDLGKHKVDSEEFVISEEAATAINRAKSQGHKICSVGTTTLKALESSVYNSGMIKPHDGWTNKFIYHPYEVTSVDALITNFHPSQSSMFMMVSAFAGPDLAMEAYRKAIEEKYHFLTYGDAMLIR
jgi:S-adenosylmethionine:tRNA ribosyltransferase-isomerase